jgi:septum formation protein
VSARLVLASVSPRRKELLERAGVPFEVIVADVDESVRAGESPETYVARVATEKAAAVHARAKDAFVLAADTSVILGREILGKAADADEAQRMIARLAGRTHVVTTAVCLVGPDGARRSLTVSTEVEMAPLADAEARAYVASGEWRGKAGAYAAQGIAASFVVAVRGSYTNVVGLPLVETLALLRAAGAPGASLERGRPS